MRLLTFAINIHPEQSDAQLQVQTSHTDHILKWSGPQLSTLFKECVHNHTEGAPAYLTSSTKQGQDATTTDTVDYTASDLHVKVNDVFVLSEPASVSVRFSFASN